MEEEMNVIAPVEEADVSRIYDDIAATSDDTLDLLAEDHVKMYGGVDERAKLLSAFTKFMGEVKNPATTKTNPFTHSPYAPLDEVLNVARPTLAKHGLAVSQVPLNGDDGKVYVQTILAHESGAMMVFPPFGIPAKNDAQGTIAALTYARRGSLNPILGMYGEADEDGNDTQPTGRKRKREDALADMKSELLKLMTEKSKLCGRESVAEVCKSISGVTNPNAINDEETLTKVKTAVSAMSKENK